GGPRGDPERRHASILVKLPRDVETEVPVVLHRSASRDLRHRRAERVREIQLKEVAAGAFFNRDAAVRDARFESGARRGFTRNVDRRPYAYARADADHEGVVVVGDLARQRIRVVHPDRLDVERRDVADLTRYDRADRRRVAVLEIVRAFDRHQRGDVHRMSGALTDRG